jgi:hypothetical protein
LLLERLVISCFFARVGINASPNVAAISTVEAHVRVERTELGAVQILHLQTARVVIVEVGGWWLAGGLWLAWWQVASELEANGSILIASPSTDQTPKTKKEPCSSWSR